MYKDFSVSFPPVWIKILKFERVSELQWGELRSSPHEYRLGAEYEISWRSQVKKRHGIIKEGRNKIGKGGGKFDFILTFVDRMRTIAKSRREKKKKATVATRGSHMKTWSDSFVTLVYRKLAQARHFYKDVLRKY